MVAGYHTPVAGLHIPVAGHHIPAAAGHHILVVVGHLHKMVVGWNCHTGQQQEHYLEHFRTDDHEEKRPHEVGGCLFLLHCT